jgi:hypothetical protein
MLYLITIESFSLRPTAYQLLGSIIMLESRNDKTFVCTLKDHDNIQSGDDSKLHDVELSA